jgi:hypothetical protein
MLTGLAVLAVRSALAMWGEPGVIELVPSPGRFYASVDVTHGTSLSVSSPGRLFYTQRFGYGEHGRNSRRRLS